MEKFKTWFFVMWRPVMVAVVVVLAALSLLSFRLGSLTNGVSSVELDYIASADSGREILERPSYLVHKLPTYVLSKLDVKNIAAYRAVSASFAIMAALSCFFVLREWYSKRLAFLGSVLFLSSAWILHVGRLATPEVSYLLLLPLLWAAIWLYTTTLRKSALLILSFLSAVSLYVPGLGWLLIATVIWRRKQLWAELSQVPWWFRLICGGLITLILLPLAWAVTSTPGELLLAAGLPNQMPSPNTLGRNLLNIPLNLLIRGPDDATKWLARLPLLDVFSTAMLLMGIYSLRYRLRMAASRILLASSLLLVILIMAGGPVTITALLPAVYILVAGGVAFMLQQWFAVFPRNPLARWLATAAISLVVLLSVFYHLSHYFVAWPQTPATKTVFKHSLVK